jgi:hypothetical protein
MCGNVGKDALSPLFFNFALEFRICHQEGPDKQRESGIEWDTSPSGL